ncbi:hypothetical protein J5J83_19875 [Azoarcus sp. L1K30]|uniref:hypothetical protein n=1 Tax=Azoarcus sp. L1K30 TaxID=2820277 RepID=UPI001B8336D3|nr:hypothetical protein [Azoarcus sp. L1K30]MBR0568387.1 hypothetical protein [Azoarcus sp. L1K30]
MNKQVWIGVTVWIAGFVLLQWHDNYTERLIAEADAEAAMAIADSIVAHGVECGPVSVASETRR